MGKINDFENDALKVERVENIFEIWILLRDTKNAENDANTSIPSFLGGFVLLFFGFFPIVFQNGVKLGSSD